MMRLNGSDPGSPAACDKKRPRRYAVKMKKSITALAARNNGLWCDAVCQALKHARNAVHSPALHLAAGERRTDIGSRRSFAFAQLNPYVDV